LKDVSEKLKEYPKCTSLETEIKFLEKLGTLKVFSNSKTKPLLKVK